MVCFSLVCLVVHYASMIYICQLGRYVSRVFHYSIYNTMHKFRYNVFLHQAAARWRYVGQTVNNAGYKLTKLK